MNTTTTYACRAIIRTNTHSEQRLEVISPRTGRIVTVHHGWFSDLPARLLGRVAEAMGRGERTSFTTDELRALVAIETKYIKATTPLPRGSVHRSYGIGGW